MRGNKSGLTFTDSLIYERALWVCQRKRKRDRVGWSHLPSEQYITGPYSLNLKRCVKTVSETSKKALGW